MFNFPVPPVLKSLKNELASWISDQIVIDRIEKPVQGWGISTQHGHAVMYFPDTDPKKAIVKNGFGASQILKVVKNHNYEYEIAKDSLTFA